MYKTQVLNQNLSRWTSGGNILVADSDAFGNSGGVIKVDPTTGVETPVSSE